jgi:hypothetical protein
MSSTDSSDEEDVVAYFYFRGRKQEKRWLGLWISRKKYPVQTIHGSKGAAANRL